MVPSLLGNRVLDSINVHDNDENDEKRVDGDGDDGGMPVDER